MANFRYGPRDGGQFDPPPWPQIVMMLMGLTVCFTAGYFGCSYEWIGQVYVRGPAAFICMLGLMFAFTFVGDGMDKSLAEHRRQMDDEE
jgi:hypothetical protein